MDEKAISIIIPVYNEEKQIGGLLSHLRDVQSGFVREIIVADGGSSDKTCEIAASHNAVLVHCGRKGRASQMNAGARAASSPILYFLHADTFPPEHFDAAILKAADSGADAGCFRLRFDDNHPLLKLYGACTRFKTTLFRFGDQSLFVKREFFEKAGRFDEALIVMEDQQIVRELKKRGRFEIIQKPVITSARKYRANGVIRLQFIFGIILTGYYLGVSQETLVHIYKNLITI